MNTGIFIACFFGCLIGTFNIYEKQYNYATCVDNCYKAYCISNTTEIDSYCVNWNLRDYCQGNLISKYETSECENYRAIVTIVEVAIITILIVGVFVIIKYQDIISRKISSLIVPQSSTRSDLGLV
jgi:hypothetical protein